MTKLVFVYGTLKRTYGNNRLLKDSKFLGTAVTCEDAFSMYTGGFPYVLPEGSFHVKGELYEVEDEETLRNLDHLEGYPTHYTKVQVAVRLTTENGYLDCVTAMMYVAAFGIRARVKQSRPVVVPDDKNILEWNRDAQYFR